MLARSAQPTDYPRSADRGEGESEGQMPDVEGSG